MECAEATKCASLQTKLKINMAMHEPPDKMWYGRTTASKSCQR
jgi:hypothetical protein